MVRAKFYCVSATNRDPGCDYQFSAVADDGTPENAAYHAASPVGSLSITVDNPAVSFEPGKYYYLDFTPAE